MPNFNFLTTNLWPVSEGRLVNGQGVSVFDDLGTEYLDLTCQTLNLAYGHRHPRITAAVEEQLRHIWFSSSRFGSKPFIDLSKLLVSVAPHGLTAVNLKMCDGSDAVETAIKLARLHTRAKKLLCIRGAWHGETSGTLGLCSFESTKEYVTSETDVIFSQEATLESLAQEVARHSDLAAVIVDPAGVSNGLFQTEDCERWLREIRRLCDDKGVALIFDEIQTYGGFLGAHLFAASYFNVIPDLLCLGKALGSGLPLAATLCREEFRALLDYNNGEFTYGGQALSCAAGLAALGQYLDNRPEVEAGLNHWVSSLTRHLQNLEPVEIRRLGFITTITRKNPRFRESWTREIVRRAFEARLVIRPTNHGSSILIKPPIVISATMADTACSKLREIVDDVEGSFYRNHVRQKPLQANDNKAYVDELLSSLGPGFSSKPRNPKDQETLSEQLVRIGIPINRTFSRTDGSLDYWYQKGLSLNSVLPDLKKDTDYALINALLVRQQNALEMAHFHSFVIGDRWPGNTLVNGSEIMLIDFDIQYEGDLQRLCLFEEMFSLFQFLSHIERPDFLTSLSTRFTNGIRRRFDYEEVLDVWSAIKNFYTNSLKPTVNSSLSLDRYARVASVMTECFDTNLASRKT